MRSFQVFTRWWGPGTGFDHAPTRGFPPQWDEIQVVVCNARDYDHTLRENMGKHFAEAEISGIYIYIVIFNVIFIMTNRNM